MSSAPSLYANFRIPTRVYDVEGGAFFSKIAHLPFSMRPRGPHAYGLRPRLWLLTRIRKKHELDVVTLILSLCHSLSHFAWTNVMVWNASQISIWKFGFIDWVIDSFDYTKFSGFVFPTDTPPQFPWRLTFYLLSRSVHESLSSLRFV